MNTAAFLGTYNISIRTPQNSPVAGILTAFNGNGSFNDAMFQGYKLAYNGSHQDNYTGIFPHTDDQGSEKKTIGDHPEPLFDEDFSITVSSGTVLPLASGYGRIVANNKIYSAKDGTELGTLANIGDSVAIGCGRIVTAKKSTQSGWIYDLDGNQIGTFSASVTQSGQDYGQSIAIGCGRIIVGAPHWGDPNLPLYTWNQYKKNAVNCGQAFLYDLNGNEIDILRPPDYPASRYGNSRSYAQESEFGFSVAIKYGRILVGAPAHYNVASGNYLSGRWMGKCFLFDCNGFLMRDIEESYPSDKNKRFGESVAFSNYKIIVGVPDRGTVSSTYIPAGKAWMFNLCGPQNNVYSRWHFEGAYGETHAGFKVAGNGTMVAIAAPGAHPFEDGHIARFVPNPTFPFQYETTIHQGLVYLRGVGPSQIPRSSGYNHPSSVIGACKASDGVVGDTFGEEISMSSGFLVVAGGGGSSQPRSDPYGNQTYTSWYTNYSGTVTPAPSNKLYVYKLKKTSIDYWDEMLEGWSGYADEFSENF